LGTETLHRELERRIKVLEDPANQGSGFTTTDWIWLALLGVVGPVLLLVWGWMS
jgi:hypothetical protein